VSNAAGWGRDWGLDPPPLEEIGQLLRHRRPLTTAIYAKVDGESLRLLAWPWPGGAA
jgi:hypothetical protein